jgi:hypothetical protein
MSNENISFEEYSTIMNRVAGWLLVNGKKYKTRDLYSYFGRVADKAQVEKEAKRRYQNKDYHMDGLLTEYAECLIFDNNDLSFLPNYTTGSDGTKYYKDTYVNMANRVSAYEVLNNKSPAIVYLKDPNSGGSTTSNNVDATLKAFKNALGNFDNTCDGALALIRNRKYSGYFNSKYNTQTTINRIKNKLGVNCTDASQLFYRLLIALGYQVQFVHVMCSSGTGHVRLRLKHKVHTGGNWILRDPAAVLNGGAITYNWCTSNYKWIVYDAGWIFQDLYQ